MKKKMLVILSAVVMLMTVCFSSCFGDVGKYPFKFNDTWQQERSAQLLEALKQRDKELLRAMFAPSAIAEDEDFEENLEEFFNYYKGTWTSYEDDGGGGSATSKDEGEVIKKLYYGYNLLKTDECVYRIHVTDRVVDTKNENNVGLWQLDIIKAEDDPDLEVGYGGNARITGINIGAINFIERGEFRTTLNQLEKRDKEGLISWFSQKVISDTDDFEQSVDALMAYYEGKRDLPVNCTSEEELNSIKLVAAKVKKSPDYAPKNKQKDMSFEVETDKARYRIAMRYVDNDGEYTEICGIRSFYIIKAEEDTDLSVPYWGDGKFTPGIHIGVKNVIAQ